MFVRVRLKTEGRTLCQYILQASPERPLHAAIVEAARDLELVEPDQSMANIVAECDWLGGVDASGLMQSRFILSMEHPARSLVAAQSMRQTDREAKGADQRA